MFLTDEQKRMHNGEYGPGIRKAMDILVRYGDGFGAERLTRVDSCHAGAAPRPFLDEVLEGVDRVRTPCTLHAGGAAGCRMASALGLKRDLFEAEQAIQRDAVGLCVEKGLMPVMSCAPYLLGNVVKPGDVFSWPGSSGIMINNSLFGGRGNRDAFGLTICSAITGLTPDMMLLKEENRHAQVLAEVEGVDIDRLDEADYGAIGYYIGAIAELKNVAINGLRPPLSFSSAKGLLSPMPVSGAVSLCHIIGITPEAQTLERALGGKKPEILVEIGEKEIRETRESLHTARTDDVEVVSFGCPHLTIAEIEKIVRLLQGRHVAEGVRLWLSTADLIFSLAQHMGLTKVIEQAGGVMVTDTCIMGFPFDQMETPATVVATNSARAASYAARRGIGVQYGSFEQCIEAAIAGKWRS